MKNKKLVSLLLAFALILGSIPFGIGNIFAQDGFIDPVSEAGYTTFSYQGDDSTQRVTLAGSMNNWNNNDETTLFTEGDNNLFTLTLGPDKLLDGQYEFKYIVDGKWTPDPGPNFTVTVSQPINYYEATPVIDDQGTTTFTYYGDDSTETVHLVGSMNNWGQMDPAMLFTEVSPNKFQLRLDINQLPAGDYQFKYLVNGNWTPDGMGNDLVYTVDFEAPQEPVEPVEPVEPTEYTYTINYKRLDGNYDGWNLWLWPDGGSGAAYEFQGMNEDYITGTYTMDAPRLGVIPRLSTPEKEWAAQEGDRYAQMPDGQTSVEVWIVQDDANVYYEKPADSDKPYVPRKIQFNYDRPGNDYDGWAVWAWSTGNPDKQNMFDANGRVDVPLSNSATNVGFKLNKNEWSEIDQDFDRAVLTDPNALERTTKVYLTQGSADIVQVPYVSGPEISNGNITFYYRDLDLYEKDQMDTIEAVTLNVYRRDLESGKESVVEIFEMAYDQANQYFAYTLEDADPGFVYIYTFDVTRDGETVTGLNDTFNTVDGVSAIEYRESSITVEASAKNPRVEAGDSVVIEYKIDNPENVEIKEVYIDGRGVGNSDKIPASIGINEQAVEINYYLAPGLKQIDLVVVDQFDNRSVATVDIETLANSDTADVFDWDEEIIYFMLTDRFADGDSSNNPASTDKDHLEAYHGGDFQGIIDNVDYLVDLGITTVWVTPIVDNINANMLESQGGKQYAYHGYWAEDFTKLDESLGSIEKMKEMIDVLNDNGIKLMVDVVLNHSGYGTENLPQFEGMIRDKDGGNDMTNALAGLPDFKTEETEKSKKLVEWQSAWLDKLRTDKGNTIDYFRVDTVKHVEHETWREFKAALASIDADFKMIGEQYGASIDSTGGYLGDGMMDSLLDFEFKNLADAFVHGDIQRVEERLAYRNSMLNPNRTMGQFLSSHDEDGFLLARLDGDENLMKVAASLQLTAKGQPVIYYGEEIGMSGLNADFSVGRYGENRKSFDWANVEGNDLLDHYRRIINFRRDYSEVLSRGDRTSLYADNTVSVFTRSYNGQTVLVALNISPDAKEVTFALSPELATRLIDIDNGESLVIENGQVTLTVPGNVDGGTLLKKLAFGEVEDDQDTPEEPSPVEPTDPEDQEDVEVIVKPQPKPDKPGQTGISPKTGDISLVTPLAMLALSGAALIVFKKKENK